MLLLSVFSEVDFDAYVLNCRYILNLAELAKLDKTERRYAWIKRRLRSNEEIWKIFPSSWHVPYLLCIQFCKLTRLVATTHLSSHVKHFILSV